MRNQKITEILQNQFFAILENDLVEEIQESSKLINVATETIIMEIDSYIKQIPLLVSGVLKVSREDSDGNELLLYYLNKGETCTMSMICCMNDAKSKVRVTVVEDAQLIMIPVTKLNNWMSKYESIRNYVFQSYQTRFDELLQTIDSIAFTKMDERLERYLTERSKELHVKVLTLTHQEIARDLNTSREVVSRLLKQMEKLKKIKLHRYKIEILSLCDKSYSE